MTLNGVFIVGAAGRFDVTVADGRFASVRPAVPGASAGSPGPDRWLSPGLVDLHAHLAWTDFHHDDQLKRSPDEVRRLQARAVAATLNAGFTTVRDAGGMAPELARELTAAPGHGLRLWASGEALTGADARGLDHVERRVRDLVAGGVKWIKVFATGGLGAPTDAVLAPTLPRDHFFHIVATAHALGARVFVHTWGGTTVDWSLEAGVDSVEHGIFLTADQAARMAEARVDFVPTAAIYRLLADPQGPQDPGTLFRDRARRASEAHHIAVGRAVAAGVRLGVGSDFGSPDLHGRNGLELDALEAYGVPRAQVWRAATVDGAAIVGDEGLRGQIAEGYDADAVVFTVDPLRAPSCSSLSDHIEQVFVGGHRVKRAPY